MKLPIHVKEIEVFYDGRCGMCCTFHEWVQAQERAFVIQMIPYQSEHAKDVFPGLSELDPAREMVVRTWEGDIYRGAEAWVWCLYSCANYRGIAQRLAGPMMLPLAMRACRLLAANRRGLSKVFFRKKDQEVRKTLHQMKAPRCVDDVCEKDQDEWREELMR